VTAPGQRTALRRRQRRVLNLAMCGLLAGAFLLALLPLVAVLAYALLRGLNHLSLSFLTHSMRGVGPLDPGGGIAQAIWGSTEQVLIAGLVSVPLGLLVAIHLAEYRGTSRITGLVRFTVDVMTGLPSIVAGLFIYAFWVLGLHRGYSGLSAGLALAVLMLPVVARASEEMLKLVPPDLRESSYALGVSRWRTIVSIVLPTASAGLTTGVMLAVARVTGETAPLLLTAFGFDSVNRDPFHGPQSALPLFVFQQATSPFKIEVDRAWTAALTLIAIVVLLNLVARLLVGRHRLSPA
jgi:phosphate transport system permease protein